MWLRSDLKERAKLVMKTCYWKAVLVSFLLTLISGSGSSSSSNVGSRDYYHSTQQSSSFFIMLSIFLLIFLIIFIVVIALGVFIFNPLIVGVKRFFLSCRRTDANLKELGFSFSKHYKNIVLIEFLRGLFTFLWSLLFIIPGMIKKYEYCMIPYLLAKNPDLSKEEAFALSRMMMDGEKWNAFVLDLSFIGWYLLGVFTCGILWIFYVNPYYNLTHAELYAVLSQKIDGVFTTQQTYSQNPYANQ